MQKAPDLGTTRDFLQKIDEAENYDDYYENGF
jgi:hypothetical protein